ncbi:Non cytoplasmic domain containing protein, conserved [Trypanosoma cruzi]|uniref:Uncharacterized protein n=2 Tax=Trypanosoma cruzi TaxID=5693 RepID=Q4DWR1_TRYCC|nr:hypothetical protein, conserved [Trypanosoma cruzi]EAN96944.1 hypothetical protein, conserved [Trypanosoma cruzi]PWV03786.1 Non cytoplasmic domain containing protein, conserved [Trypanosoma cruzi]RNC58296.1 hypothetical protein TcCL_ESM04103 [Trypanosoma cruzi]|eukprot:XP_818795.1 hypothetical protein [Trypanosoma cruzi strain CL Brener]
MTGQALTVLSLLCTRALVVLSEAAPSMSTARYLSSVAASTATLSSNATDAMLLRCANDFVQRLASLLPLLRTAEPLQEDVAIGIFRIAKSNGSGNISPACIDSLLKEVDERLVGPQFAIWKPQTVLASLHAIAIASPSGPLKMVDTLLFCAKEQISQLDERKSARLLWCVATLRKESAHATLWRLLCGRLVRFSRALTSSSRSLVVEALIIVQECTCDAQHELLCVLHENRLAVQEGEAFDGEEVMMMGYDYQALKERLLSDVHLLSVDSIIHMVSQAFGTSSDGSDEANYLIQHLLSRPLKPVVCRELLELLAKVGNSEVAQSLRMKAVECIRGEYGQGSFGKHDPIRDLATVSIAFALERQQTLAVSAGTRMLLEDLIARCHGMSDGVWDRYSGRVTGVLAVALDVLASFVQTGKKPPSLTGIYHQLEQFPESWERGSSPSAVITECAACVCSACHLLRVLSLLNSPFSTAAPPSSVETATLGDGNGTHGSLTEALLRRCTDVFSREGTLLPRAVVFDMWRASTGVEGTSSAVLQPLMELLLNYTEKHPADFPLREVAKFFGTDCHRFPAEAFELFVRCLRNESDNVASSHLDMLVSSMEGVAARGDKALLQRLQLMLFLRPIGHEKALIHAVLFKTPQLVRLFNCCNTASDLTASMQATLLELMVSSCGRCTTMEELNTAASLLPHIERGALKDALAWALAANAQRMHPAVTPDVQKALLIVYLQKGGVAVEEDLLQALRRRA